MQASSSKSQAGYTVLDTIETVEVIKRLYDFVSSIKIMCDGSFLQHISENYKKLSSLSPQSSKQDSFFKDILNLFTLDRALLSTTRCVGDHLALTMGGQLDSVMSFVTTYPCNHGDQIGEIDDHLRNLCLIKSSISDDQDRMLIATNDNHMLVAAAEAGLPVYSVVDDKRSVTTIRVSQDAGSTVFKSLQRDWERVAGEKLVTHMVQFREKNQHEKKGKDKGKNKGKDKVIFAGKKKKGSK